MHFLKTEVFQLFATGFSVASAVIVFAGGPELWTAVLPDIVAAALI